LLPHQKPVPTFAIQTIAYWVPAVIGKAGLIV